MEIMTVVIAIIVLVLLLVSLRNKQKDKYTSIDKLPGPSLIKLIKLFVLSKNFADLTNNIVRLFQEYGSTIKIWIRPFNPVILTADANVINDLLNSKLHLDKPDIANKCLSAYLGEGLATVSSEHWKETRKVMAKIFNQTTMDRFLKITNAATDCLLDDIQTKLCDSIDVQNILKRFSLETVIDSITDARANFNFDVDNYLKHHNTFFRCMLERLYTPYMQFDFIYKHTKNHKDTMEAVGQMKRMVEDILTAHQNLQVKDIDILCSYLAETNLSQRRKLDNLATIIEGAHGSSAATISFSLFELSRNPDMQQKILEENISIIGNDPTKEITMQDTQKMKYLETIINETLRYYSIVNWNQRVIAESDTIGGIELPEGTVVTINATAVHMSKYYENTKVYNPDRFSQDNFNKIPKGAFTPFSFGPRDCIGKPMAMHQMKLVLSKIVRKYKLYPVDQKLIITNTPIAKSSTGLHVTFRKRN